MNARHLVGLFVIGALSAQELQAKNYIPNGSFENGSSTGDYATNVEGGLATEKWIGGILTRGSGATFCSPAMADGNYGLALHYQYAESVCPFDVPRTGLYRFSCKVVSREWGQPSCQQALLVYFDDQDEAVSMVMPDSSSEWISVSQCVRLVEGAHRIRFVGVLSRTTRDSSVVVDDVRLEWEKNVVVDLNGSFELLVGSREGQYDCIATEYETNGRYGVQLRGWTGGIVARGCSPVMGEQHAADGGYAMILHNSNPEISRSFAVAEAGKYEFSFATRSSSQSTPCQQTVSVYFDNEKDPICAVTPTSTDSWDVWKFTRRLKAGEHSIRIVGENPIVGGQLVDSITIVDDVRLVLYRSGTIIAVY